MKRSVHGEPAKPQLDSRRPSYVPVLKAVLVVSLAVLLASVVMRFSRGKLAVVPSSDPAIAPESVSEPNSSAPRFRTAPRILPGRRPVPTHAPDPNSVALRDLAAARDLWSAAAPPGEPGHFVTARLLELRFCAGGVETVFEQPAFYRVPAQYSEELREDYGQITEATNVLGRYEAELSALMAGIHQDRQDYLRHAKYADTRRKAEGEAVMKQLVDLQALYVERRRQFDQESARIKPTLLDPPDVFDRKLPLYEAAANRFAKDMRELESAILTVQQQILATVQTLRMNEQNIDTALGQVAQEAIGRLHSISNRAFQSLGEVNGLIRNYNAKIGRYGSPAHLSR
jgi:hypothetical protein